MGFETAVRVNSPVLERMEITFQAFQELIAGETNDTNGFEVPLLGHIKNSAGDFKRVSVSVVTASDW